MSHYRKLKALVPAPLRAAVRRLQLELHDLYNQRRLIVRPFANTVLTHAYGKRVLIPIRYRNYGSPVKTPPTRTWKSIFFELLRDDPRGIFLDIGANMGQTLLEFHASDASQSYIGFEANPICVGYCAEIIHANQMSARVYCCGLSNKMEQTELLINPDIADDSGASIIADLRPEKTTRGIPVVLMRLQDFRETIPPADVALVKIDVEGAENLVLEGASDLLLTGDPVILCEVLRSERPDIVARHTELKSLFDRHGYDVFRIIEADDARGSLVLEPIDRFPAAPWTMQTADQNDYLICRPPALKRLTGSGRIFLSEI